MSGKSLVEGAVDPCFRLPLLLQADLTAGTLLAPNGYHLAQLHCYVAARLRDEQHNGNSSWSSRLPSWVKSAKNRDQVLKALDRLEQIADAAGIDRGPLAAL